MSGYNDFLDGVYNEETGEFDNKKAEDKAFSKKESFNIILLGATGVGKSALVNAMFGDTVVKSDVGTPVTQKLEKIKIPKKGITLWDTKGIESKDYKGTIEQLRSDIENAFDSASNEGDLPHLGWLCIDSSGSRIEPRDLELINLVKPYNIPLVIVFTKSIFDEDGKFASFAENEINKTEKDYVNGRFVKVNSVEQKFGPHIIPADGLDKLLDISLDCLPLGKDGARQALKKAQMVKMGVRLDAMISAAERKVHMASAAAGAVGASPIPGSDAPLIAAIQSTMIYKINAEFELDSETSNITAIVTGILGITAVAQVGKTVVSNALKFIPGVGTLLGGAISATTAFGLTEAVGHAYIKALTHYYNHELGIVELPSNVSAMLSIFKEYFKFKK
ncbi:YcjF family protein [Plesiomonas shigelloides]|uniref:YcjF family protein n=1 Tax=Plesiomonas shigelloides TaxID=703 RepID=UPI0022461FDA|nr:GTPase [Plesiomonas shigelloides]MCX2499491.1 50S ribosome-binding GTPase [Plesiomonas shigelloides]